MGLIYKGGGSDEVVVGAAEEAPSPIGNLSSGACLVYQGAGREKSQVGRLSGGKHLETYGDNPTLATVEFGTVYDGFNSLRILGHVLRDGTIVAGTSTEGPGIGRVTGNWEEKKAGGAALLSGLLD